jgi:hypothetical protein
MQRKKVLLKPRVDICETAAIRAVAGAGHEYR